MAATTVAFAKRIKNAVEYMRSSWFWDRFKAKMSKVKFGVKLSRDETPQSNNVKYGVDEKQYVFARNDILVVHVLQNQTKFLIEIVLALSICKFVKS